MKKVLYLVMAAMVMFSVTSCNEKAGNIKKNPKAKALDDSISQTFGEGMGKNMLLQEAVMDTAKLMPGQQKPLKIDKKAFLQGMKDALSRDTTASDQSYVQGFLQASQLVQQSKMMEQIYGVNLNMPTFIEAFEKHIAGKVPTEQEMMDLDKKMQDLMQKAQSQSGKANPMMGATPQGEAKAAPAQGKPAPAKPAPAKPAPAKPAPAKPAPAK